MQLDYPQKANGMYIIRKEQMDDIAEMVLSEYAPRSLCYPCAVDISGIAENAFNLTIESRYLAHNNEILGVTIFHDSDVPCYDQQLQPEIVRIPYGTVIIHKGLAGMESRTRRRFTLAHESSHWILHRSYNSPTNLTYQFRKQFHGYIACRSVNIESHRHPMLTDHDWEEWQADTLAAALLMPKEPFLEAARDELGLGLGFYRGRTNSFQYCESLARIASRFQVSKKAISIRLEQLGLIHSVA
jgi:Zn-dependent peptidase ImmA (M78 family)